MTNLELCFTAIAFPLASVQGDTDNLKSFVSIAAPVVANCAMLVTLWSATRAFYGSATHANFTLTAKAFEMIGKSDPSGSGKQLLRFLGTTEQQLTEKGLSLTDFAFVTTLFLGRAAYYEVTARESPDEDTFKTNSFSYHLCSQPDVQAAWDILGPMWGDSEKFVQLMNNTINGIRRGDI